MTMAEFRIEAEYTGQDPNLRPAASAFARMIKSITNADGAFADPELEEEFQNWEKENARRRCNADGLRREH